MGRLRPGPGTRRCRNQVLGLTRSDGGAQALVAVGASVHRGDLDGVESLRAGMAACDGAIHTAFKQGFSEFQANAELDRRVIEAMGDVLAGSDRPFITTSGTLIVALGGRSGLVTEQRVRPRHTPRALGNGYRRAVLARCPVVGRPHVAVRPRRR